MATEAIIFNEVGMRPGWQMLLLVSWHRCSSSASSTLTYRHGVLSFLRRMPAHPLVLGNIAKLNRMLHVVFAVIQKYCLSGYLGGTI